MKIRKQILDGNVETIILSILLDEPSYGYQIIKKLFLKTDGLLIFGEGTIYAVLHRLEERKLITAKWLEADNSRMRKYYKVTAKGKKKLSANIDEWKQLCKIMQYVIVK